MVTSGSFSETILYQRLTERRGARRRTFDTVGSHDGEYCLTNPNGSLGLFDNTGPIRTAQACRR